MTASKKAEAADTAPAAPKATETVQVDAATEIVDNTDAPAEAEAPVETSEIELAPGTVQVNYL